MKEGWEYKKLGELALSMADGPFGSNLKKEHYTNRKEVRIIQLSNIGEEGWREDNTKYTSFEHLETIKRSEVTPGDLVIAKMMPAGRAIICPNNESKYVLSSDAVRVTLKEGLNNRFILFSINSPYFRKQVYENVSGSGRVRTSLTKLRDCKIYLPSLSEQQSIVAYLDSAFAKIDTMKANAEKALNEAKALFQASLKEMLEPKEGWTTSTLKDECYKITDGTHQTPKYYPSGYIFLSSKNVTSRKIDWENVKYIDESQHQIMHQRVAPKVGDILLAKNGTTGVAAMVDRDIIFDIYVSLALLRSKGNVTPEYLLTFVNSPIAKEQFNKRLIGMGVPNLHLGEINQVVITYPKDKREQAKMTQRIEELDNLIIRLQANFDKISQECDALKQAILRQVFE